MCLGNKQCPTWTGEYRRQKCQEKEEDRSGKGRPHGEGVPIPKFWRYFRP